MLYLDDMSTVPTGWQLSCTVGDEVLATEKNLMPFYSSQLEHSRMLTKYYLQLWVSFIMTYVI